MVRFNSRVQAAMLQGGQVFEAVDEGRPRRPKPRPEGTHQEGASSTENRRGAAGCLQEKVPQLEA